VEDSFTLVFEHDHLNEAATVKFEDGKFKPDLVFTLDNPPVMGKE
jgi:hypothetical protein